jgi:hypothetical protein
VAVDEAVLNKKLNNPGRKKNFSEPFLAHHIQHLLQSAEGFSK